MPQRYRRFDSGRGTNWSVGGPNKAETGWTLHRP
nr:MAG TPA: hypothetical protein [Caudoviricetes sp.]